MLARSSDPFSEQLARHHTRALLVTAIDDLLYLSEAAWTAVPVNTIQSLYDSMSRRMKAIIAA